MTRLQSIRAQVASARALAIDDARGSEPYIRSRGTFLSTGGFGGQVGPRPEAEALPWDGTLREIETLVAEVLVRYPEVDTVYLSGGYDAASRLTDFAEGNYEPWVSAWDVPVWRREKGWLV